MELWDGEQLRDSPEVDALLLAAVAQESRLAEVRYEQRTNMGVFFSAQWLPTGHRVVIKLNASSIELEWMPEISRRTTDLVPQVYASGDRLGEMEVGWLVLADAPHQFHSAKIEDCRKLMTAAARFQLVASEVEATTYSIDEAFLTTYLPPALEANCPGPGEELVARIPNDLAWVDGLTPRVRCHGDVHFGNAVASSPGGQLLLVDPIPRTACWAWDAAYAEGTSGVPGTSRLVPLLAAARDALGLPTCDPADLDRLQAILLGWSSMMWWAILPWRRADPWWAAQVRRNVETAVVRRMA